MGKGDKGRGKMEKKRKEERRRKETHNCIQLSSGVFKI